jgi:hypothetical protein
MHSLNHELWMEVPQRRAIVSIQRDVERLVAESGVQVTSCELRVTSGERRVVSIMDP